MRQNPVISRVQSKTAETNGFRRCPQLADGRHNNPGHDSTTREFDMALADTTVRQAEVTGKAYTIGDIDGPSLANLSETCQIPPAKPVAWMVSTAHENVNVITHQVAFGMNTTWYLQSHRV
jgi:hypothetical protein